MIVLGIETAGPRGSVAVLHGDDRATEATFAATRRLGAELAPAIQRLMKDEGLGPLNPPDLIAVDLGPGSYTGLRIGLATAKALSFAWGLPLIGVSTTDALSAMAIRRGHTPVLCALDASRGQVYAALYAAGDGGILRQRAGGLVDPTAFGTTLTGPTHIVGDAAETFADATRGLTADPELTWPSAIEIARAGRALHLEGTRVDPLQLAPNYYRPNEAETLRRKRAIKKKKTSKR